MNVQQLVTTFHEIASIPVINTFMLMYRLKASPHVTSILYLPNVLSEVRAI